MQDVVGGAPIARETWKCTLYPLSHWPGAVRVDMAVDVRSFYGVKRPRSSAANEEEEQNIPETVGLLRNPFFIGY